VISEDNANREIANGFRLVVEKNARQFWINKSARGWLNGRQELVAMSESTGHLQKYKSSNAALIVDFDGKRERGSEIKQMVAEGVRDRVFVIGVLTEPEKLRNVTGMKFEQLGSQIGEGCKGSSIGFWQHDLLVHNIEEIRRLSGAVRDIFFNGTNNI
jgi:hypothetical protein